MNNSYSLRIFDTDLATFSLEQSGIEGLQAEIETINEEHRELFPLDMKMDGTGIVRWLRNRVIPKNRAFVDEILRSLKLTANDTKGIIDVCKGLSLNDSYWIVPQNFTGKFSEYNLFENRFSEILSLVAYTGAGRSQEAFSTSPELTTGGMLPKAWRFIENDGIYLYKGGTVGAANAGNEPFSEFYSSQIADAMEINHVHYDIENWKGITASKCALFTDINTSFISVGRLIRSGGIKACAEYYSKLGSEFLQQLADMLVFDAVIYNEDRHFGNFGLLRNNHTGEILSPAPIFDNGLSLFNYAMPGDINNLSEYALTRRPVYNDVTFEKLCIEVMGKTQRQKLRRLIGFKFTRHPHINLPNERLVAIEKHIQRRVGQLLELPIKERHTVERER
ncbi:MAG: XRE family transcriptional regulator [Oscillospiraceae bacterium]